MPKHNPMISVYTPFDKSYNQKKYEADINSLNFSHIRCTCQSIGNFKNHANYDRFVLLDPKKQAILLNIKRIRCQSCLRTHALLPFFIIPYRIVAKSILYQVIHQVTEKKRSLSSLAKHLNLSRQYLQYLLNFFKDHHQQRLLTFIATHGKLLLKGRVFCEIFHAHNSIFFMQRTLVFPPHIFSV